MKIATALSCWIAACVAALALGANAQPPAQPPQVAQPVQQGQQLAPAGPAAAAPRPPEPQGLFPQLPTVPLQPLLDRVARAAKKPFLVDGRIGPDIYLAGVRQDDVTYPLLLSILRANGLATVELEGRVNIIPANDVRFYGTPIVQNDDASIAADEWITRIVTTTNVDAAVLVPVIRPLLPVAAHLAALPPSSLIVMDRYANVQRITAIVKSLDQPGAGRRREE